MPELIGLADRVLVMAEGRITGELGANADEQSILASHAANGSKRSVRQGN